MAGKSQKRSRSVSAKNQRKIEVKEKRYAYRVEIQLEDYLFFASTEKGKVAETAPLLHNYALAYAMGWVDSPYYHKVQSPNYWEQLSRLNDEGVYLYPARPLQVTHRLMQYNTTPEPHLMTRTQSTGYPNWGFIKCIRPGSLFSTYVVSHEPLTFPKQIRLGKWMSKASLVAEEAEIRPARAKESELLLNIQDLSEIPAYFQTLYHLLPTRLVAGSEWGKEMNGYKVEGHFLPESAFGWRELA